jgi:antitoxin VapB
MSSIINNQDVEKLLNDIVKLTGESRTEAVRKALKERRLRITKHLDVSPDEERLLNFLEDEIWCQIPAEVLGTSLTKAEEKSNLGYG